MFIAKLNALNNQLYRCQNSMAVNTFGQSNTADNLKCTYIYFFLFVFIYLFFHKN